MKRRITNHIELSLKNVDYKEMAIYIPFNILHQDIQSYLHECKIDPCYEIKIYANYYYTFIHYINTNGVECRIDIATV